MIAEIFQPFDHSPLKLKICYHIDKIERGVAEEIYNSLGDSIYDMYRNMLLVQGLNNRVKLPFIEISISSPVGEMVTNDLYSKIAQEYMERMGYGNACYSVIKHDDKDTKHIHILTTTIDLDGTHISDSENYDRSYKITRELEKKYGLQVVEKGITSHNRSLGESQFRQYFFDTALHKALRSHNANERVNKILLESDTYKIINPDLLKPYTNSEWKIMLGDEVYEKMLEVLSDSKFFNPLFKDELLAVMDRIYPTCKNVAEFREKLENENYYMRLVSNKGKSYYTYGIPERNFYVKDKALPEKYRFGRITFESHRMSPDEQKHYLYNKLFAVLNDSTDYVNYKTKLKEAGIKVIEHSNKLGIYGLSFSLTNINSPEVFKSSDISRRLTYQNIHDYFRKGDDQEISKDKNILISASTPIKPVIVCYINTKEEWERELSYMSPASMILSTLPIDLGSEMRHSKQEDEIPSKKKKKRKNKGLSI